MTTPGTKKLGLFACTTVVAGNMMGSGIALLPANLAGIGSISVIGWLVAILGAMGLAYVFARLGMEDPQEGGPLPMPTRSGRSWAIRRACSITTPTG